jgi:alkylation response protein AidB-like acyl-CoA dehydrogenase
VLGGLNNGWNVAMATLGFERGTSATTGYRRFERELGIITDIARSNGSIEDPTIRQRLAWAWSHVQIMRINGLRSLTSVLNGTKDRGVTALGLTNKMFWSEYHQKVMELALDILGMDGQILTGDPELEESVPGYGARRTNPKYPASGPAVVFLLLPLGDDLGRHGADPAQHRRRAVPRPPEGAQARTCQGLIARRPDPGLIGRSSRCTGERASPRRGRSLL